MIAPSAAPPSAIRVWASGLTLFAEIPGSPPYIMKLSLTEAGLSKALALLRDRAKDYPLGTYQAPERLVQRKGPAVSQDQRQAAVSVLRKLGMV